MRLPIQLNYIDGHIWLQCTHPACLATRDRGKLVLVSRIDIPANGSLLEKAIEHADKVHGVP